MAVVRYKQKRKIDLDNLTFEFLRCVRGQSNEQIAAKAGLHHTTIYKLRHNVTRYPSVPTMMKVFKAYNYSLNFISNEKKPATRVVSFTKKAA